MEEIDKLVRKYIMREYVENKTFIEAVWGKEDSFVRNLGAVKIWFEGLNKYGLLWSKREYKLRRRFYNELR